mgnify:CR=1 FL=1
MIYEPREDSYLLEKEVKKYAKGKKVLDMGSGNGILVECALKSGAKEVLAVDVDSESLKILKKKNINAINSDLFENVKGKFDLIVFNPPYLPDDNLEDIESKNATTGGKKGDEIILKFLREVDKFLEIGGLILLLLSSLTPTKRILKLLKKSGMKNKVIAEKSFFFEKLEVWKIERKV